MFIVYLVLLLYIDIAGTERSLAMRREALQAAVKEAVRDGALARLRTTAPWKEIFDITFIIYTLMRYDLYHSL